jgi:hypothetical protein
MIPLVSYLRPSCIGSFLKGKRTLWNVFVCQPLYLLLIYDIFSSNVSRVEGVLSVNHFWGTPAQNAYAMFGRRFPALNVAADPKLGLQTLLETSATLRRTKEFIFACLGGRDRETVPANIMTDNDLFRILEALPGTPSGHRLGAYLSIAHELGHRPAMYLLCFPSDIRPIPNTNPVRYMIEGLRDVKMTSSRVHSFALPDYVSFWVKRFIDSRPFRDWKSPSTFFGFSDVLQLDMEINKYAMRAGNPN